MNLYYDLHIHSCLSPCADELMTPKNICSMASLKGLDLIALTDHNSAGNVRIAEKAAMEEGILFLPGIEICTQEEVHLLAYFDSCDACEEMGAYCYEYLPHIQNKPDFFGEQVYIGENNLPCRYEERLLISALTLSLEEVVQKVRSLGGVAVPAHIYRGNGIMTMLGFIPPQIGFTVVEIKAGEIPPAGLRSITSSDAHELGAIAERKYKLNATNTREEVLAYLSY
jgi:hypothetical protein